MSNDSHPYVKIVSAAAVIAIVFAALFLAAGNSLAADTVKNVRGFVWDSEGRAVEGAEVVVSIKDGETTRSSTSEPTDSIGFYSVSFAEECWDIGNTIEVIAEFDGKEEMNSTGATSNTLQWVNVTFEFEIPEFGSMTGLLVTGGLLGAVAVVALVYFRKR